MARYAIFSDMHGNLEAYRAVVDEFKREGGLEYLSVGDIVGYGADPSACIEITKELDPVIVCGNHDRASAGAMALDYFNENARDAILWTASVLSGDEKDYLKSLDLTYAGSGFTLVHGTLVRPADFGYILNLRAAAAMMELMETGIAFIGHTHAPGVFILEGGGIEFDCGPEIGLSGENRYIVNVGSVGQPRDGDPRASFCIWDEEAQKIEIRRTGYDIGKAQQKIIRAGLPGRLAERLGEAR